MKIYKAYQKTIQETFSKIPLIFQDNNYLPTEEIYIELALSDYSTTYQNKIDSFSRTHYDNIPILIQERKIEKEIRKLPMKILLKNGKNRGFVVLGDPGSGKSTLLKTIAYRSAIGEKKYPKYIFHIELKKFVDKVSHIKNLDKINLITEYISKYILKENKDIFRQDVFDETPYFLIDGWDEISDNQISDVILDSINDTTKIGKVIVTSRRAGRLSGFNGFDFYEIIALSSRSIRNYILNFAKAQNINHIDAREKLLNNILNSESLVKMAQNPFLLSLICYLKSKELDNNTPYKIETKVELYYRAIEEIKKEFQNKFHDRSFLAQEQKVLEDFSLYLFNYRGKTKHIFSEDDFIDYTNDSRLLKKIFLPSKILDVFRDTQEIFFIHLTFQEFLTAMSLARLDYKKSCEVIQYIIDKPSWREVLRFYAGILHSNFKPNDALKKFDYILEFAWNQKDELGLIESEIAYWFVEANIDRPKAPFDNLKKSLWERFKKGKECAGKIFRPILQEWRDEDEITKILFKLQKPKNDLTLLMYIPFVANSSNIFDQQKIMELIFSDSLVAPYPTIIASSLGVENRVELIEYYCQNIENMSEDNIILLLKVIASSQDSEYYKFIEPLLIYGSETIKDEAYETAIKIQAEPFLENIEHFFKKYIEYVYQEKFSILYYWEDEKIIQLLNSYALDNSVSIVMRKKIMEVMYENMHRESISILDKNDYLQLLENSENIEIKTSALLMYSALLSVTPTEKLIKEFDLSKKAEEYILSITVNKDYDFELRLASLQALRANRLRGIQLFHIYYPLRNIIFDTHEDIEIRNNALEALCEQAYYFSNLSIVQEVFAKGLKEFMGEMLINTIFFIGQYGYHDYISNLREFAQNGDSSYIRGIAIQSLGDLNDQESFEFIYNEFKTQKDKYIREIAIESIIKLKPTTLLKYKNDEYVYSQLCLYIVENGESLREKEIEIEESKEELQEYRDIFISHASEDKKDVIEPLIKVLEKNNITYWVDSKDISWGDNLVEKINIGLVKSSYFLVVVSDIFLSKNWAKAELNTLMSIEISTNKKRVLPLLVGDVEKIQNQFKTQYPLLHPKLYLEWNNNPENIAIKLNCLKEIKNGK